MIEAWPEKPALGVNSRLIGREEIAELVPGLDLSERAHQPILAGLYHPPGVFLWRGGL